MESIIRIKYILIFTLALALISCDDVLDKEPLDILSDNIVWTDPALIDAYIVQVYGELPMTGWLENVGEGREVNSYTQMSDEGTAGYPWTTPSKVYKPGLINESGGFDEWWNYILVRKINEFFVQIEASTINEDLKKLYIAKMRFARAFTYFSLVKRYGGIPIITTPQDINSTYGDLFVPRNKEVEVYDFVLDELDKAITDLPESYDSEDTGWPNMYAAYALKSRVALYAASIAKYGAINAPSSVQPNGLTGISASEAKRFYQESYDASAQIINSGKYFLYMGNTENKVKNFTDLFLIENNSEVIFSKQYSGGINGLGHRWDMAEFPPHLSGTGGFATSVYLEMVNEFEEKDGTFKPLTTNVISSPISLVDFFSNKDPRFHASIFYEGSSFKGGKTEYWNALRKPDGKIITGSDSYEGVKAEGIDFGSSQGKQGPAYLTGFNVRKFCDPSQNSPLDNVSTTDFPVFRYAEILLNHIEAAKELEKPNVEILKYINDIRYRAGIALLTGNISLEQIRHERKVELFSEGHRFWDLKRWRIAEEAITKNFSGIHTTYDAATSKFVVEINNKVDNAKFAVKHYYYPITPGRIANNPSLAPENPNY